MRIDTRDYSARDYLDKEVDGRARHATAEHVRTTCSFAHAERLLGKEYHGRFLIELLQNAADASRDANTSPGRSRVVVQITEGPALLVANEGAPMSAEVVIESLGHIGATTKAEGEAIGHKGIGFKSVLEVTLTPEIYSGLQRPSPALAVGFDPERASEKIRTDSPRWNELVAGVQGLDAEDPFAAVPVLRFPHWIEQLPTEIVDLKDRDFDTVVRLPFDERFAGRLGLDADAWLASVRDALRDVSDQILLLLGCFDEVRIEDRLAGSEEVITPEWQQAPVAIGEGVSREVIRVWRDGHLSSRWRLFRRTLPDQAHLLAGEVAVGIRVDDSSSFETVLPALDGQPSAPFHLFFPTRILSGLPFLLHAYFEVDAARTGFYRGPRERNQTMLDELAELAAIAVADAAKVESLDLAALVNLVAEAGEPEDPLAQAFRSKLLDLLDDVAWIPLQEGDEGRRSDRPQNVFAARPQLVRLTGQAFPAPYVRRQAGLGLPDDRRLSEAALELVMSRWPSDARPWDTIESLCRPGETPPWDGASADRGFLSLLDLLAALDVEDRTAAQALLDSLRRDPASRLIPTMGTGSGRVLLPIPDPSESAPGRRSRLVMARRSSAGGDLVPPPDLDVAFLPDGLLSSEAELDRARPLGVRPFTVDDVLDRLNVIQDAWVDGDALVRFLWQLLAGARESGFSTRRSAARASAFDPSGWFWCQPGRAREDDTARLRQQRERYLAAVPLPCRDGIWRPAGRIAFGADWANWLEEHAGEHPTAATQDRISAYRAMEELSPGPGDLLAPPEVVLSLLDENVFEDASLAIGDEESGEAPDERRRDAERHAFLLRLGVWEIPPIEAYESRTRENRERFPWTGPVTEKQREIVERNGGWRFGLNDWAGRQHHNVYLAEDYRFLWPLEAMARRNVSALVTGLRFGAKLYRERSNALVFCTGCSDGGGSHRAWRHSTSDDGYPSSLAIQLRSDRWVPCTLDGDPLEVRSRPESAWWHPKPPSGAGLRQSPWRLVPLCGPAEGIDEDLRRLVGINTLDDAPADVVEALLIKLREQFEQGGLPSDPATSGSTRQAFVGLHRLAYERLSELSSERIEVAAVLDRTGVLCELGDGLVYRHPGEARHDDGRFATYVRRFVGSVPFAVLPRDSESTASRLGIAPFRLQLTRRGEDDGRDMTDDVRGIHGDRIAELLAIVVHHSLGTQTLDMTSLQFEERARRIQNLRIKQLDDLIVDAVAEGPTEPVTIGEGSTQDLFLEAPTSASPVLFHDLSGDGWQDRLRRKIAPYLATVLENQAYAHAFALFLQAESDAEREEFLIEIGISADEVDAIAARIGVVREEEQQRHMSWFRSILDELGAEPPELDLDPDILASRLEGTGLDTGVADRLVELGGGEAVRRESGKGSALRLLAGARVDLQFLDKRLREAGDPGLDIRVARNSFSQWVDESRLRLSAVLATKSSPDAAKATVRSLKPPPELRLSLDPSLPDLLSPVVDALRSAELHTDAHALARDPASVLATLGGFSTVEELDDKVLLLFDKEERERFLRERAAQWRREIQLLAVLARTGPAETRANIREIDENVATALPSNPPSPADLQDALVKLLGTHPTLTGNISERLVDTVNAIAPDRDQLMEWARQAGVAVDHLPSVQHALEAQGRDRARALRDRSQQLANGDVRPVPPPALLEIPPIVKPVPPRPLGSGPRKIGTIKVGESHDRRKRELGDEGEQWALAAVVGDLMALGAEALDAAIGEVVKLLKGFKGTPVDKALAHATRACAPGLDDEERIDELSDLLHVSRHSDAFGFDLIGWLPSSPGGERQAVCLEVKSSGGKEFHLSRNQWSVAEQRHGEGAGDRYAVLVVRRAKDGGVPTAMDLLSDPVALVETGYLRREADGYQITY